MNRHTEARRVRVQFEWLARIERNKCFTLLKNEVVINTGFSVVIGRDEADRDHPIALSYENMKADDTWEEYSPDCLIMFWECWSSFKEAVLSDVDSAIPFRD